MRSGSDRKIEGLVIQALKEIGKDNVTEREISIILDYLKKEEPLRLTNDIKLAPEWIRIIKESEFILSNRD